MSYGSKGPAQTAKRTSMRQRARDLMRDNALLKESYDGANEIATEAAEDVERLRSELSDRDQENSELKAELKESKAEITDLKAELAEVRAS